MPSTRKFSPPKIVWANSLNPPKSASRNPFFENLAKQQKERTPSHLRGRRASILWQRPPCFSGADISKTSLRAFSSVKTIPDIHQPRMYWSPQRGPTPEQKRVVSALLTHAGMHLVTVRHFSSELEHGYRQAVPLGVLGQERLHARARDRARDGARAAPFCRFRLISHRN